MPPSLALFLCISFIYFLLRFERKQTVEVSKTLWIPLIWLLVTGTRPLGAWLQISSTDPQQGSSLDLAFQAVLILASMVILIRRDFDWNGAIRENAWLIALVIFMFISTLWSDLPSLTLKRVVKEFLAVLIAFVVLSEPSPRRAIETLLRRTTYIFIPLSPVLIKYFPEYGRFYTTWTGDEMWTGVTIHKNGLARLCIISAFFLIWSLTRRWKGDNPAVWKYQSHVEILLLAITFWLLGGPGGNIFYSATSFYALSAGLLLYSGLFLARRINLRVSTGILTTLVLVIIGFGIVSVFAGGSTLGNFASASGRDATLTGRTQVWNSLVPVVMRSPIGGRGFGVFWTPGRREYFQIPGAHNGYLDVLLGLGFVGLLLVSAFLLSSCRKAYLELSHDFDWGVLWICYIFMSLVHNIGESSIDSFTSYLTAIILILSVSSTNIIRARSHAN